MTDPFQALIAAIRSSALSRMSGDKYAAAVQALDTCSGSELEVKLRELAELAGDVSRDFALTKVALKQAADAYKTDPT